MKTTLVASIACLALIHSFTPLAAAQEANPEDVTSDIAFYGHVFGTGRGGSPPTETERSVMPMNTQFPLGEADLSQGQTAHSCNTVGDDSCEEDARNEVWLYTTAGFVQTKQYEEFAYSKLHNERGLTKDTYLDTTKDITASFYMSADSHGWLLLFCTPGTPHDVPWPVPCWNWDPGLLAQWQIQATVYTGVLGAHGGEADTAPDIAGAYAAGKLVKLAEGVSEPQDVKSLEPAGNPTVWKFDINLGKPVRDHIAKEESYLVRFKWWSVKPDGSRRIVPQADTWNVDSGEYYPPVVHLPVKGAFTVEYVVPQFVYEKLVLLGIMNTPWGSYDVNQDSIKLDIKDAKGNAFTPVRLTRLADFSVAHGGHYKPVNVTYVWDYKSDKLPPGDYTATVSATNYQGSAGAQCSARFTVLAGGHPGPIQVGQCGVRTISDEQLDTVKEGSQNDAQKPPVAAALPAVPLSLASAGVVPVQSPLVTLAPALALALALVLRRWSK